MFSQDKGIDLTWARERPGCAIFILGIFFLTALWLWCASSARARSIEEDEEQPDLDDPTRAKEPTRKRMDVKEKLRAARAERIPSGGPEHQAYLRRVNRSRLSRYGCFIEHEHKHAFRG